MPHSARKPGWPSSGWRLRIEGSCRSHRRNTRLLRRLPAHPGGRRSTLRMPDIPTRPHTPPCKTRCLRHLAHKLRCFRSTGTHTASHSTRHSRRPCPHCSTSPRRELLRRPRRPAHRPPPAPHFRRCHPNPLHRHHPRSRPSWRKHMRPRRGRSRATGMIGRAWSYGRSSVKALGEHGTSGTTSAHEVSERALRRPLVTRSALATATSATTCA